MFRKALNKINNKRDSFVAKPSSTSQVQTTQPNSPSPSTDKATLAELFRSRGDDRAQAGNYNGAIVMYDEALDSAPTDTALLLSRSFAYAMSTPPRLDLALKDADTAIHYNPTNWQAWQQHGETCLKMGNFTGAEDSLVNALGFARGYDKVTAQRALSEARSRKPPPPSSVNIPASPISPTPRASYVPPVPPTQSPPASYVPPVPPAQSPRGFPFGPTLRPAPSGVSTTRAASNPNPTLDRSAQTPSSSSSPTQQPYNPSNPQATSAARQFGRTAPNLSTPSPGPVKNTSAMSSSQLAGFTTLPVQPAQSPNSPNRSGTATSATRTSNPPNTPQTGASPTRLTSEGFLNSFNSPVDAPPGYTPSLNDPDPAVRILSQQAIGTKLKELETTLKHKNRGSISVKPYIGEGFIDAVQLVYVGLTQNELTSRELGIPTYLHPSFANMTINAGGFPGNTLLNYDCECSPYYEGKLPGTVTISGYSKEYRSHQLSLDPRFNITLESNSALPGYSLDKVVQRITSLQLLKTSEDNELLGQMLGLSQLEILRLGFHSTGSRQKQIDTICMKLSGSLYDAPTRFIDFSKARNISNNTLGSAAQGIGLQNFLYQILLGAELLVRLQKQPVGTNYNGIMTDAISALVVLSALWMQNVSIQTSPASTVAPISPNAKYTLYSIHNQRQIEGLIRFGEALSWPYMDEARAYIENVYRDLVTGAAGVGFDICDWLFGLVLPGKVFRHRIMCCLVYASPSIRSINASPFWDSGLVAKNKSYWPKRSVLGRVLGGLHNSKSVCGWVGPVPAPEGWTSSNWIIINARNVDVPIPVSTSQLRQTLEGLGLDEPDSNETTEAALESITDINQWIQALGPPPPDTRDERRKVALKAIRLTEVASAASTAGSADTTKEYRANLDFNISGTTVSYVLYSNPLFVSAPPCVGTHLMHRRQAVKYLGSVVNVADLKDVYPPTDKLVIIDAQGMGEQTVARAWCAERARHAIVRKSVDCCFACALSVANKATGLGFNVLIWS